LRHAAAAAVELAEMKHRGWLTRRGGMLQQRRRACGIVRHVHAEQQQQPQAQLRRGIAARRAQLEPLQRARMIAALTVRARVQHAEAELAADVLLLRSGCEPTLSLVEIARHAESSRVLVA